MTPEQHDFLKAILERSSALINELQAENKRMKYLLEIHEQFKSHLKLYLGITAHEQFHNER